MPRTIRAAALCSFLAPLAPLVAACHRDVRASDANPAYAPVSASAFCVTSGHVDARASHLHVDASGMRGVVAGSSRRAVELAFTYRGPSHDVAPLANGELRRQIGVKLRAQDTCNVVYVMWHVAPTTGIVVTVKRNPGKARHAECRADGYTVVEPRRESAVPLIRPGEPHTLRAELDPGGATLRVSADGAAAWEGPLPRAALDFDGPAGIRSDNGEFDFDVRVPPSSRVEASCQETRAAAPD